MFYLRDCAVDCVAGARNPGRQSTSSGSAIRARLCSTLHAIVAGGSHIDHVDLLRCGGTEKVLPFRVMAPSTRGSFLRAFTFGHVRQLEADVCAKRASAKLHPTRTGK